MRLTILSISQQKNPPEAALTNNYLTRLPWQVNEKTYQIKKKLPPKQLKEAEAEMLLNNIPNTAIVIALDEHGSLPTSKALADKLAQYQQETQELYFVLGGAYGHGQTLLQRANYTLSLSKLTFPHQLAKLVLIEQLYRSHTIMTGHPYHKE